MVPLRLLCATLLMASLAACADPEIIVRQVPVTVEVPEELRGCPVAPAVPGAAATQKDVAAFIIDLHEAHSLCFHNLRTVDAILDDFEERAGGMDQGKGDPGE